MKSAVRFLILLAAATACAPLAAAPLSEAHRAGIVAAIDRGAPALSRAALQIWRHAELGFHERESSELLQQQLREAGFEVEVGVAGMPTAFIARFRTGNGPIIGLLAEFDALPGMSQAAEPVQKAQPGMTTGHACGHNLFGAASVAAAIAASQWMAANAISGELRVYGSPAEEGGSGKVFLVRAGLTKDVSAMLHWHPSDRNGASQERTLANVSGKFRFQGVAAHAAAAPDRGRSALDGVEAMNHMVNLMREHIPQDARIHYVITDGGRVPNVVPDTAEVYYYIRHPEQRVVADLIERVQKAAEGAALGTGTTVAFDLQAGTFDTLPNDALGRLVHRNLMHLPLPAYTAQEQAFIDAIRAGFPAGVRAPGAAVEPYASGAILPASSDVGDVSYTTPTAGMTAATWAPGTAAHSWQAVAASGHSVGVKGALLAAGTLALSAAELLQSPDVLAAASEELQQRRGADFTYRPLLGDKPPALDYRQAPSGASP